MYMSELNQNIHLLLPKKELDSLRKMAKKRNQSVGSLIREAIHRMYWVADQDERVQVFERLKNRKELGMDDWDQVKKELTCRFQS